MRRRTMLLLLIPALFAAALLLAYLLAGSAIGREVVIIRPAVAARYDNAGKPARDDEVFYGMTGTVLRDPEREGQYLLRTEYGYQVLVHESGVMARSRAPASWRKNPTHLVAAPFADVAPAPDLKAHPLLLVLRRGAYLRVTGASGDYSAVQLHDGATGYVRTAQLREIRAWTGAGEETNRQRVTSDALSYLGVPYRWGGKTPQGIDCSGLVSMAFLLNGLPIYRNASPRAGHPVALMHLEAPAGGHDRQSIARARPGDVIYWDGHQALYLGDGKYIHANATDHRVCVNSLFRGDADYRDDLADPAAIVAWGTVYPERPEALQVRHFAALPAGEPGRFRFFARLDGYAPTAATLYPEGAGAGKPAIAVADPGRMVHGPMQASSSGAPEYRYSKPGRYYPAIVFVNADGWLPAGQAITSGLFTMTEPVVVE